MITKYYKEVFSCSAACEEPKKEAKEAEATEAKEEKPKEEKKCVKPRNDINRSEKHMKNAQIAVFAVFACYWFPILWLCYVSYVVKWFLDGLACLEQSRNRGEEQSRTRFEAWQFGTF